MTADHTDLDDGKMLLNINCEDKKNDPKKPWDKEGCMAAQLCAMLKAYNESPHQKQKVEPSPSEPASNLVDASPEQIAAQRLAFNRYSRGVKKFGDDFTALVNEKGKDHEDVAKQFHVPCLHAKWSKAGGKVPVKRSGPSAMNPDHMHPVGLGGPIEGPFKWADKLVNETVGRAMSKHKPETHPKGIKADPSCNCDA